MKYKSTRGSECVSVSEALLRGLASDGGLYVPENIPGRFLDKKYLDGLSYEETAEYVLGAFMPDIPKTALADMIHRAYADTFSSSDIVPVHTVCSSFSMAEMFHGKTCAFKDLALSLFPYLLTWARNELQETRDILILTATSGDTGKAALEGFKDVPGTKIQVFYPEHGVSPLQKEQMCKQEGNNVNVVGIEGNFDDAQSALKKSSAIQRYAEGLLRQALFFPVPIQLILDGCFPRLSIMYGFGDNWSRIMSLMKMTALIWLFLQEISAIFCQHGMHCRLVCPLAS